MTNKEIKKPSEERRRRIPSIRLSYDLLKELLSIIDYQYQIIRSKDDYGGLTIVYEDPKKDRYTYHNVNDFLEKIDLKRLKKLGIWLHEMTDKDVMIDIQTGKSDAYYTIKGTDQEWSREIRQHIADVFEKFQTRSDFFHSRESWIFWTVIGFIIALVYEYYLPSFQLGQPLNVLIWTFNFTMYLRYMFILLFPRVETEYMMTTTKIRKWILLGLSGIPFALIGSYLYSFIG